MTEQSEADLARQVSAMAASLSEFRHAVELRFVAIEAAASQRAQVASGVEHRLAQVEASVGGLHGKIWQVAIGILMLLLGVAADLYVSLTAGGL
jgi:hypothetical protein